MMQTAPDKWRLLRAHGLAVGLPSDEDMGNSEVGHNALGAGRIFEQGCVGQLVTGVLVNLAHLKNKILYKFMEL